MRTFSSRLWTWGALMGILLIGAFLRLYQLDYKSLWVDEIGQVLAAQGGVTDALHGAAQHAAAPPLDYVVTWALLHLGNSEFVLRFAPAVWSILTIAALYALAKRLTRSTRTALLAAYVLAVSPLVVRYAQEVRFYALAGLLTLLCVYAFVRAWERPTRGGWVWFALATLAAFYAHYYIVFVLAALVVWMGFDRKTVTRARLIGFGASLGVVALGALPWLLYAGRGDATVYVFSPPPLADMLADPMVGVNIDPAWRGALDVLGVYVLPLLAVVGVAALWRTRRAWGLLLALIPVFGVAGVWGGDFLLHYFYTPRQLLFLVPFYLLLVVSGLMALLDGLLRSQRVLQYVAGGAALAGITLLCVVSLQGYYDWVKDDWRSAARLLKNANAQAILTEPTGLGVYLGYYQPVLEDALDAKPAERVWVVTQETAPPPALDGMNAIRLDTSPALKVYYAGKVSPEQLWREIAPLELPPQVVAYSDVLSKVQAFDAARAQQIAARALAEVQTTKPPLLDSQIKRLERKVRTYK